MLEDLKVKLRNVLKKEFLRLYIEKVLLILLGLFLAMLFIEALLRLFPYQLSRVSRLMGTAYLNYRFEPDPFLFKKLKPNMNFNVATREFSYHFQTVSLGYEGIGFRDDGIDSECFAVALGDSFTEGWIDKESLWVELLEKETGLDFVNMGVSGYSSIQNARMLQKYGAPLGPKLVIWTFFFNDFYDSCEVDRRLRENIKDDSKHSPLVNWLRRHSLVYQLMRHTGILFKRKDYSGRSYKDGNLSLVFNLASCQVDVNNSAFQEGWRLTQESLLKAQTICKDIKAELLVILVPSKEQSYWHVVNGLLEDPENCTVNEPNTLVKNFCKEQGIAYLDLTPVFREHAQKGKQLYYTMDGHWNKEGNQLAAEAILTLLKQESLLP